MGQLDNVAHPAVARSVNLWHEMVAAKDLSRLPYIVHPDAVFRSPVAVTAYNSRAAVILALNTVLTVFEDFVYYRELVTPDGLNVVLEFSAVVSGKRLKGIDLIKFNEQGQIVEFEVMVRPLSGLQALAQAMGAKIGDKLPAFKDKAKL